MPTRTVTTSGTFYVRKRPGAVDAAHVMHGRNLAGEFRLELGVMDNQGRSQEPYIVHWDGEEARQFWVEHAGQLHKGRPLELTLERPRSVLAERARVPHTEARVLSCALLPTSQEAQSAAA